MKHNLGLTTFYVIVGGYSAVVLPFCLIDYFRLLDTYKIQPNKHPSRAEANKAMRMVFTNFFVLYLVNRRSSGPLRRNLGPIDARINYSLLPLRFMFYLLIDDICFYIYHRTLHAFPILYRHFHKPHHYFKVPFAAMTIAVHPVELMLQSIGGALGPMFLRAPIKEFWLWVFLRQVQGIEDHTGYEFKYSPTHLLPFLGGTKFHDLVSDLLLVSLFTYLEHCLNCYSGKELHIVIDY